MSKSIILVAFIFFLISSCSRDFKDFNLSKFKGTWVVDQSALKNKLKDEGLSFEREGKLKNSKSYQTKTFEIFKNLEVQFTDEELLFNSQPEGSRFDVYKTGENWIILRLYFNDETDKVPSNSLVDNYDNNRKILELSGWKLIDSDTVIPFSVKKDYSNLIFIDGYKMVRNTNSKKSFNI